MGTDGEIGDGCAKRKPVHEVPLRRLSEAFCMAFWLFGENDIDTIAPVIYNLCVIDSERRLFVWLAIR